MNDQRELSLFKSRPSDKNVQWLEGVLRAAQDWMTAVEILRLAGYAPTDDNKRFVRQLASASEFILSGPGSPGYKHIGNATPEEVSHYVDAGISQGKQMIQRALRIRRSAHTIFG